jgi:hypothetical protein
MKKDVILKKVLGSILKARCPSEERDKAGEAMK